MFEIINRPAMTPASAEKGISGRAQIGVQNPIVQMHTIEVFYRSIMAGRGLFGHY